MLRCLAGTCWTPAFRIRDVRQLPGARGPVHVLAIPWVGLPVMDNALLEPLAEPRAEAGCWEFMVTLNPLNIRGGTGSPANPIALS